MLTVVVLPLVPVTVSHGAAPHARAHPPGQLDLAPDRDAGCAAAASSGWSGRQPGRGDDQLGALGHG